MANASSRPGAPRSAASLFNHCALMSLDEVRTALNSVEGSLDALLVLLRAAGGAFINTDHIEALLAPVHQQLLRAANDLNDLPLVEPSFDPLPVLQAAAPAPRSPPLIVIEPDLDGIPGAVVTGYYFNRMGDGYMHAFGRYDGGYFLYDGNCCDVWGTFEAMSSLLGQKMGGAA